MNKKFDGFSFEKETLTPIPVAFFTQILQKISDLAELKVVLFTFWWQSRSESTIPYLTLKSFMEDTIFITGFGDNQSTQLDSLTKGIELAVEHNILLETKVTIHNKEENIYILNTQKGEAAVKAIQKGNWQITDNQIFPISLKLEFPNIFTLYEENIGPITPMIADALKEMENLYPPDWIEEAFNEAIKNNVRKLRYIEVILQNWQKEGRNDRTDRRRSKKSKEEDDPERYIKGKFSDFIEH